MALGNGWSAKAPLTIDSSLVSANVTNLPILLVYANFPTEILGVSGGCKVDGSDIRFTADIDGVTEYARDIIQVDKDSDILTCYVKIPSISSSVDTTFYVWWNNPNGEEPAETSASGSRTCWSDYYGVYHFKDMLGGWKGIQDSSARWTSFTEVGAIDSSTGHAEGLFSSEIGTTFGMQMPETLYFNDNDKDFMFWVNGNGTAPVGNWCTGTNGIPLGWLSAGQFGAGWGNFSTQTNAVGSTGWYMVLVKVVSGTATCYVNMNNSTLTTSTSQSNNFPFIGQADSLSPVHSLSELRMTRELNLSVDYYNVMYACESNPNIFVSAGTPIIVTASLTITIKVVDQVLNPIETAQVYIDEDFVDPQIMNKSTDVNGETSITYDGAQVSATLRVRKYGYKAFTTPIDISTVDVNQTVTMITDPQQT